MSENKLQKSKIILERAKRARELREHLLNVSRGHINKIYGIPISTQQTWEDINLGNLSEEAALTLIKLYKNEGYDINLEWLMYGVGKSPLEKYSPKRINITNYSHALFNKNKLVDIKSIFIEEKNEIIQELELFYELHPEGIHLKITDEALSPWLMPGDFIAGEWFYGDDIEHLIGLPCINLLDNGEIFPRLLRAGSTLHHYDLVCTNPDQMFDSIELKNIGLQSVAPIFWIWKNRKEKKHINFSSIANLMQKSIV